MTPCSLYRKIRVVGSTRGRKDCNRVGFRDAEQIIVENECPLLKLVASDERKWSRSLLLPLTLAECKR